MRRVNDGHTAPHVADLKAPPPDHPSPRVESLGNAISGRDPRERMPEPSRTVLVERCPASLMLKRAVWRNSTDGARVIVMGVARSGRGEPVYVTDDY